MAEWKMVPVVEAPLMEKDKDVKLEHAVRALEEIAEWPLGGEKYGQDKIMKFAKEKLKELDKIGI